MMKPRDIERLQKFRKKLIQIREAKGLSQRAVSYQCDVGHAKISKLETVETTNLTLTTFFELARGLGVHPRDLLDFEIELHEEAEIKNARSLTKPKARLRKSKR